MVVAGYFVQTMRSHSTISLYGIVLLVEPRWLWGWQPSLLNLERREGVVMLELEVEGVLWRLLSRLMQERGGALYFERADALSKLVRES